MKYKNLNKSIDEYEDIINLPHHVSAKRPRMAIYDRAAQFSPFAAVTGHDAAIAETARETQRQVELDDAELELLSLKLKELMLLGEEHPIITVTYFRPDERKSGGEYLTKTGQVKKIDEYERKLIFADGVEISLDMLSKISEKK